MNEELMKMLMGAHGQSQGSNQPDRQISKEGQIERLREWFPRYQEAAPFNVGDLVTPRVDCALSGAGNPMIVIEVRPDAEPWFGYDYETAVFGIRPNIRVLKMDGDNVVQMWAEAALFERYQD